MVQVLYFPGFKEWVTVKWCDFLNLPDYSPYPNTCLYPLHNHIHITDDLYFVKVPIAIPTILLCYHYQGIIIFQSHISQPHLNPTHHPITQCSGAFWESVWGMLPWNDPDYCCTASAQWRDLWKANVGLAWAQCSMKKSHPWSFLMVCAPAILGW